MFRDLTLYNISIMTNNTYNIDYLKNVNKHKRDSNINFYEPTHTYTILNDKKSKYTSVTTFIHTLFDKFDADKIIQNMMKSKNWKLGHKSANVTSKKRLLWSNHLLMITLMQRLQIFSNGMLKALLDFATIGKLISNAARKGGI